MHRDRGRASRSSPGCAAVPAAGRWRSRRPRSSTCCWRRSTAARHCARRRAASCGSPRSPAPRSARSSATSCFRRFPGSAVEWIGCLALFGALLPVCVLGGRPARLRPAAAAAAGRGAIGSCCSPGRLPTSLSARRTSPATMLGELATLPLQQRHPGRAGGCRGRDSRSPCSASACSGSAASCSRRRGAAPRWRRSCASRPRSSDLRTVVLLRRQLASEQPRGDHGCDCGSGTHPVWRRDWQGLLRWPPVRIVRVLVLAASAGAVAVAAWSASVVALCGARVAAVRRRARPDRAARPGERPPDPIRAAAPRTGGAVPPSPGGAGGGAERRSGVRLGGRRCALR